MKRIRSACPRLRFEDEEIGDISQAADEIVGQFLELVGAKTRKLKKCQALRRRAKRNDAELPTTRDVIQQAKRVVLKAAKASISRNNATNKWEDSENSDSESE